MNRATFNGRAATLSLLALICLCVLQEMWLAPLRPGGSWLVLKALPLVLAARGVLRHDNYTMQWSSMLVLLYFTEGVVRATSDRNPLAVQLSWGEVVLALLFFFFTLSYLRPLKQEARRAAKTAAQAAEPNEPASTP